MEISNVHDKYFKLTFSDKENMKDLIRNTLPDEVIRNIDIENIVIENTNLVDDEYKESYSDILVRTKIHNKHNCFIYFLYDHKSYTYKYTQFQLLKYMIKIWDKEIQNFPKSSKSSDGENNLSLIIPITFYHGRDNWTFKTDFSLYFNDEIFNKYTEYIPTFNMELYNLINVEDYSIKGNAEFITSILLFKYIFRNLKSHIKDIFKLLDLKENLDYHSKFVLKILFLYILSTTDDVTPDYLISELESNTLREVIMSVKDQIEKDAIESVKDQIEKKAMERGITEGERKKSIEAAKKMLEENISIDVISKVLGLSKEEIKELSK